MNVKKTLEERIRGWFPKDASFPSTAQVNQKTSRHKLLIVYATIFAAVFATIFLTYGILEVLSLGSYPSYAPATAAGVAAGIAIVLTIRRNQSPNISKAGKAIKQLQGLENRIRGWFPKEPSTPSSKIAAKVSNPPKTVRIGIMVAILALMVVAAVTFLVPFMAEVRVIIWVIRVLMLTMIVAAIVHYRRHGRIGRKDSVSGQILQRAIIGWRVRAIYPIVFGLGTGFMLSAAVVLILGQPLPSTYSLLLFFAFIGIGAVIGEWVGKKVGYRWPIWAQKAREADEN